MMINGKLEYICNGLKPDCSKTFCYYLGNGECRLTFDERYAISKEKQTDEPVQNTSGKQ